MLTLHGLTRRFGDVVAVDGLSLEVGEGELLSLLGPSGCGKTTTLRMIAGFETPTAGRIVLGGRDVTALPPQRRGMGMVFQNYALFPHLDVRENVAFGLRSRGDRGADVERRVATALETVELAGYAERRVQALSGGQQQRVALARALAPEPPVLLLDEPLSNLDTALRERTREELRVLLKRLGMTSIFVTHDQEEAFALSDRIAVLERGRLQQVGTPEALYAQPVNAFVAGFVGKANFLAASVEGRDGERLACRLAGGALWPAYAADGTPASPGARVRMMVRPEALRVARTGEGEELLTGRVLDRRFAGATTVYRVAVDQGEVLAQGGRGDAVAGDAVSLALREGEDAIVFPAEEGA